MVRSKGDATACHATDWTVNQTFVVVRTKMRDKEVEWRLKGKGP